MVDVKNEAFRRGALDCYQDRCENCAFASVGGLEKRGELKAPDYVNECDAKDYLEGYVAAAEEMFGEDWRTCEFEWKAALTIGADE